MDSNLVIKELVLFAEKQQSDIHQLEWEKFRLLDDILQLRMQLLRLGVIPCTDNEPARIVSIGTSCGVKKEVSES